MTNAPLIAGIDLGGTKIEARVFDTHLTEIARHRIATPTTNYDALLAALTGQVTWILAQGDIGAIGLGTPGLTDPATGKMLTSNLPATGQTLAQDVSAKTGQRIATLKDSRAFTLSEARDGAGAGGRNVIGLIIGTGVSCGQTIAGTIVPDLNGQAGEYGHLPLPAAWVAEHKVPFLPCGCGLTGCYETYLAGPGLVQLAIQMTGQTCDPPTILADQPQVRAAWIKLLAYMVAQIIRSADPDIIVLGGGLGTVAGLVEDINTDLTPLLLANTKIPRILPARFGDASGARGAALFAQQEVAQ